MSRLRNEVRKMLTNPDFAEKLNVSGSLEPLILTPAEFSDLIARDYEKYGKIVKEIGVKVE